MAENPTTPGGALPPKRAEAAKVQPKKETVRINLPPKPTSAPTIKLPTLAAGSPPPSGAAAAPVAASASPASRAPAPPAPPSSGAAGSRVAAAPATATATRPAPAPAPRPMPAPSVARLSSIDAGLAIASAVISVVALAAVIYLAFFLKDTAGI